VHGDAHTGNWKLVDNSPDYSQTTIDFDYTQRSWYVVDIGTMVWYANMKMLTQKLDDREQHLANMKRWVIDEYGWGLDEDQLRQGC
jgi:Ser/Thr protein kinase RdoA (MazF antagonist)